MDFSSKAFIPCAADGRAITLPNFELTIPYLRRSAKAALSLRDWIGHWGNDRARRQALGEQQDGVDDSFLNDRRAGAVSDAMFDHSAMIRQLSRSADFLRNCSFPNS